MSELKAYSFGLNEWDCPNCEEIIREGFDPVGKKLVCPNCHWAGVVQSLVEGEEWV